MAIGASRIQTLRVAHPLDPALDQDNPAFSWDEYFRTGDVKHLPMKDGFRPTWFTVKRLTPAQFRHVMTQGSNFDRAFEAVCYGLTGIDNFTGPDGSQVVVKTKKSEVGPRLTDDTIEAIFSVDVINVLGIRILTMSNLDPTLAQG